MRDVALLLVFGLWSTTRAVYVDYDKWIRRTVGVENHCGFVVILAQVLFERVAEFSRVRTIRATELVNIGMRLEMTLEHRVADASVRASIAFEGFRLQVVEQVRFQMMLVSREEGTLWTSQKFFWLVVSAQVFPRVELCYSLVGTFIHFATVQSCLALRFEFGHAISWLFLDVWLWAVFDDVTTTRTICQLIKY